MYESNPYFYGTGRRKESVARVRVYAGTGKVTINDRDIDDYFGLDTLKLIVNQPLVLTNTKEKFDIVCRVNGGGVSGQAGAIRHGIARALLQYDASLRPILKKAGLLTRDPRMKERKKYGLKAARRAPLFCMIESAYLFNSVSVSETLFFIIHTAGPHSIAVAVEAKNSPQDCFLHAPTVLKEIISLSFQQRFCFGNAVFYHPMRKENTRMQIIYSRFGHTFVCQS